MREKVAEAQRRFGDERLAHTARRLIKLGLEVETKKVEEGQ
jgi:hypothetical protein